MLLGLSARVCGMSMKTSSIDEGKYLETLISYVRDKKITTKKQIEMILDLGNVSTNSFVNWVFGSLGKSVNFDDLSKLIDMGFMPKTFVTRKLKFDDKFDRAPNSFQEKYASILRVIEALERKVK